jgi:5-oxoprolinase (ATP-hydrolysing)
MSTRRNKRLGIDVGGTYTDVVLLETETKRMRSIKVPSTPRDFSLGILRGIDAIGVDLPTVEYIVHGATVGVNTIIQKKGARTGLLTTRGFEDVLEIGDMCKPDMYNLFYRKARPLVSRENRLGIGERVSADGQVLQAVSRDDVVAQVSKLKSKGINSLAVCTLNSYRNSVSECAISDVVREVFPELKLSVAHRIVNQRREVERTSTTVVNAYIAPAVATYLEDLEAKLASKGFNGIFFIMSSNGGVFTASKASEMPVYTLLSGPVAGAIGCRAFGEAIQNENIISFDMGGTSCDIAVILKGEPEVMYQAQVEGYPVMTPIVKIDYLGAGGGSIAKIVGESSLRVGPESAGAEPGPACYGTGGEMPTVTDANLVLGRLDASIPLAGGILMRRELAIESVRKHVGEKLGLSVEQASLGIIKIACVRMAHAIRALTIEQGLDPRNFTLVSFGGAGAMHTPFIAPLVGVRKIVVPWSPGTFCAWGMLNTDLRHNFVKTVGYVGRELSIEELADAFASLGADGIATLTAEGVPQQNIVLRRSVDLRYRGQEHTLTIPFLSDSVSEESLTKLRQLFDETHERKYAHSNPGESIEFVNVRLEAVGVIEKPGMYASEGMAAVPLRSNPEDARVGLREIIFEEGKFNTAVYQRETLPAGTGLSGPALILEPGSTTLIPPGYHAIVDGYRNIEIMVPAQRIEAAQNSHVTTRVDPITVEVIWNALIAAANEMKIDVQRTSYNWIISEMADFSVGIFNEKAETIAQAPGLPEFVCDMPSAIRSVAEDIGGYDRFAEGDVYLTNDPYANTFHVHDVNAIKPIFLDGRLIGFACARVHWHDIGGMSGVGTMTATEVFQEGLILRSIRVCDKNGWDKNVLSVIRENNRVPENTLGDLRAQIGACTVGERRVLEIIPRYGIGPYRQALDHIMHNGERQALDIVAKIPEGEYEAETCVDNDGIELDRPLKVKVKVIVKDQKLTVDFAGSAEDCKGSMHCNKNTTSSIARVAFKMLTTPSEPANEGHFRMIHVKIPDKSIFNARKPQATLPGFFALEAAIDVIKRALAPAVPGLVNADDYGRCTPAHIKFRMQDGSYAFLSDTEGGGWGGKPFEDGENALLFGFIKVTPIEQLEARYPVRLRQYSLRQNSGGPGKYRGGLGIIKDYECLMDAELNAGFDRQVCPPQGILGGGTALGNRLVMKIDGKEKVTASKVTDYQVLAGQIISFQTGGGGGYGNRLERDFSLVEDDLRQGYISPDHAEKYYCVEVDAVTLKVNRRFGMVHPQPTRSG